MWGNNQWGYAVGSVPGYSPAVVTVQKNDASNPIFDLLFGETADFAFDATLALAVGEIVSGSTFSTDNSNLSVTESTNHGNMCAARISNSLNEGDTATLSCSITTSFGQTLLRSLMVICRQGPSS